MKVKVFAPAKINLTLHVTGLNDAGYHVLDSLVVFADVGDWITAKRSETFSLSVDGPMADGVPCNDENLVLAAARLFGMDFSTSLKLVKNLPLASGIGGGSADAAATIRAMSDLFDLQPLNEKLTLGLGSDVPVCVVSEPTRMEGVGERLTAVSVPPVFMVLVNSGVSMPTPEVFSVLEEKDNPPMQSRLPDWSDTMAFYAWLTQQRNDLQKPAIRLVPEIQQVLGLISTTTDCRLARMSGSGATCFGLYDSVESAETAMLQIRDQQPDWWIVSAKMWCPLS